MKYKLKQGHIYHCRTEWHELKWSTIPMIEKDVKENVSYERNWFYLLRM